MLTQQLTRHFSEDDLILLHYGELADDARHLDGCDDCRQRLEALRGVLAAVDDDAIPEPPADYEDRVWRHVSWRMRRPRRRVWLSAAAAAALLIIGFLAGQRMRFAKAPADAGTPAAAVAQQKELTADERLAYAAESHFDRSSRLLLEVANGEPVAENGAATELVATNRLYRVMATRSGASDVAALLDELEPILLELEHGGDAEAIRARIEEQELLFKLRVIRSRVGDKAQPPARPRTPQKGIGS